MTQLVSRPPAGELLRAWRQRRRLSQLDLSSQTGVSTRHLSFVETGRSRPTREMLLRLAEELELPLRARNELLLAGGFAPAYAERPLGDPAMNGVRQAVDRLLASYEPYPAVVIDRTWHLVAANRSVHLLTAGAAERLLQPPVNVLRLTLHPDGLAPRIANLAQWRTHVLHRLAREAADTGDPGLASLHGELAALPGGRDRSTVDGIVVPLRLRHEGGELTFFSTVTTFGAAVDITAAELSIEAFLPADRHTGAVLRHLVEGAPQVS